MSHYLLEQSVTGKPSPFTTFYYPHKMFWDAQTTLNILVTLEDAFIAAYLVGVRCFSTPDLRVTAARIMGIESDHRTLARVVGPGVAKPDGGPIERSPAPRATPRASIRRTTTATSGRSGGARSPGRRGADAVRRQDRRRQAGFDTKKSYEFMPFTPTVPSRSASSTPSRADKRRQRAARSPRTAQGPVKYGRRPRAVGANFPGPLCGRPKRCPVRLAAAHDPVNELRGEANGDDELARSACRHG